MSLNLISDRWISVRWKDGTRSSISPHEMADPQIAAPDWPRADLNLACYELLIGLVFMAAPPEGKRDWAQNRPDSATLRDRLNAFSEAFDLLGDGPRFLQDIEQLPGAPNPPDMLFIDSSGGNTIKNNADLMVHRNRYDGLDLPLAAMALYAFQQFAPAGGAGNRTSMRGGGPLVTLADPGTGLWDLVWANVPNGAPARVQDLPWMRPTRTSEQAQAVHPEQAHPVEAFFGMPRRLRLVGEGSVTGVVQRPYGTNYALWMHPLSPYYRKKVGEELLPRHPSSGRLPYRNWAGIVLSDPDEEKGGMRLRAACIREYYNRYRGRACRMIAAGWAMDNMKPKDFLWSELPLITLKPAAQIRAGQLIEAASIVASGLRQNLPVVLAEGSAREAELDHFWTTTEGDFTDALAGLTAEGADPDVIAHSFLVCLGAQALRQFQSLAVPGMADSRIEKAGAIVAAHRQLRALVQGRSKSGQRLWAAAGLEPPEPHKPKSKEIEA